VSADCQACEREALAAYPIGDPVRFFRRMIVCPECGNKRCPRASDHRLDCTGSNEPGQAGSVYR
jgi:hypothetical protein